MLGLGVVVVVVACLGGLRFFGSVDSWSGACFEGTGLGRRWQSLWFYVSGFSLAGYRCDEAFRGA